MALGILNNLNSTYAESNLNKTSENLSKTLQQLSSGSKINSGSDDAAGLSLVNGLQANQSALTQSQTNSAEGKNLLTVADGALSQVTSLLNRAVTLATEASNGTLDSTQLTATNQEYQSILSEVNNIGSTTTYNGKEVFGTTTDIYTGDSTASGASVNQLNIRSLSSSNVGDTGGTMSYTNAATTTSNIFLNSGATGVGTTAYAGAASAATNLTFAYETSSGTVTTATVSIAKSATLADVASDINNAGLGITASVTTAQSAGAQTAILGSVDAAPAITEAGKDEGIMITGSFGTTGTNSTYVNTTGPSPVQTGLIVGTATGGGFTTGTGGNTTVEADATTAAKQVGLASSSGVVSGGSTADVTNVLSGNITFQTGTNTGVTINMKDVQSAESASTYTALANYVNSNTQLGVTATVNSGSGLGSGSITFASNNSSTPLNISDSLTDTSAKVNTSYTANSATSVVLANSSLDASFLVESGTATVSNNVATIGYADGAGANLSSTNLSSQADAQSTLTTLNAAITDVASQDGYVGAQINQLNSASSVLSTQQENIQSAQNDVQATDYAAAASNMSKYQILSQTGISALSQANSTMQEVTKLLQ
jgi:flagellin